MPRVRRPHPLLAAALAGAGCWTTLDLGDGSATSTTGGPAACPAGEADCDGNLLDCEATLATDPANCGACGKACAPNHATSATCAAGLCQLACDPSFADCDGDGANGCEANTMTGPESCGGCGRPCAPINAASALCQGGTCVLTCEPGYEDCDRDGADGCEEHGFSSVENCGACGAACVLLHASSAACLQGACVFTCDAGYGSCDGDPAGGCEADLASEQYNCGACGKTCANGCTGGACEGTVIATQQGVLTGIMPGILNVTAGTVFYYAGNSAPPMPVNMQGSTHATVLTSGHPIVWFDDVTSTIFIWQGPGVPGGGTPDGAWIQTGGQPVSLIGGTVISAGNKILGPYCGWANGSEIWGASSQQDAGKIATSIGQPLAVAAVAIPSGGAVVYWTSADGKLSKSLGAGSASDIYVASPSDQMRSGFLLDPMGVYAYIVLGHQNAMGADIVKVALDGSAATKIASISGTDTLLAGTGTRIYWVDGAKLLRVASDGSGVPEVIAAAEGEVGGIAAADYTSYDSVYWTSNQGGVGSVMTIDIDDL